MCRRIAELCGAVASLERRFPLEGADTLLGALHRELEAVLLRLAAHHFPRNRLHQLVFLINNYDMVLAVLTVSASQCSSWRTTDTVPKVDLGALYCQVAIVWHAAVMAKWLAWQTAVLSDACTSPAWIRVFRAVQGHLMLSLMPFLDRLSSSLSSIR